MSLVEQRNGWLAECIAGTFLPHFLFEDYKANRNSELWRSSAQLERLFEYILFLERKCEQQSS